MAVGLWITGSTVGFRMDSPSRRKGGREDGPNEETDGIFAYFKHQGNYSKGDYPINVVLQKGLPVNTTRELIKAD
jgi:hypothetical protein